MPILMDSTINRRDDVLLKAMPARRLAKAQDQVSSNGDWAQGSEDELGTGLIQMFLCVIASLMIECIMNSHIALNMIGTHGRIPDLEHGFM